MSVILYPPSSFLCVLVVGKCVFDPLADFFQHHAPVLSTAQRHLNEDHVGERRTMVSTVLTAYL